MAIGSRNISALRTRLLRGSTQSNVIRARVTRMGMRPGIGSSSPRHRVIVRHGGRGGFFGSVFKAVSKVVSTVAKVPVVGTLAKTALGSLPIVGQALTAVNAVKSATAAAASPSINSAIVDA